MKNILFTKSIRLPSTILACAIFSACSVTNLPTPTEATTPTVSTAQPTVIDWKAAAIGDIEAAYTQTVANHPGMIDPINPNFATQLKSARDKGLRYAANAADAASYKVSLDVFSAAIGDGHAGVSVRLPNQLAPVAKWPGFITVWRGDSLLVYESTVAGISAGDKVISCDGVDINTLILRNVFEFFGRSNELGLWWVRARTVLVDSGNPAIKRPENCTLKQAGDVLKQHQLQWSEVDKNYTQWREKSYNGDELAIGLSNFPSTSAGNIKWIAMPSFQPNTEGQSAYAALNNQLARDRAEVLNARAVVLDLRHNQGGSSQWSNDIAKQLWGKDAVTTRKANANARVQIWWRVTTDHERYLESLKTQDPNNKALAEFATEASNGLSTARKNNQAFYIETEDSAKERPQPSLTDFNAPVYVIVPGQCSSACLDAVDVFSLFPNTKLIGAPSSADSTYMEVRGEPLPSKMARVTLPLKIWVNRQRGNGEFYKPAIAVTALDWSTENFLKVVDADLKARNK